MSARSRFAVLLGLMLGGACGHSPQRGVSLERDHVEPDLVAATHTVGPGETLYSIAKGNGVSPEELAKDNGISDPASLRVGQQLVIPDPSPATAETETDSQKRTAAPRAHARLGRAPTRNPNHQGDLEWPLRGVLYARFGKRGKETHDGIDLAAPKGTPVKTARAGTVLYAGEQRGYGLIAVIEHDNGLVTLYAHNNDLRVKTGQKVRSGQVIAT